MLGLMRFDPKVRRRIREIRHDRHIGGIRPRRGQSLEHGAVEIRHQRNHQIRLSGSPVTLQLSRQGFVTQANKRLQELQFLTQA